VIRFELSGGGRGSDEDEKDSDDGADEDRRVSETEGGDSRGFAGRTRR